MSFFAKFFLYGILIAFVCGIFTYQIAGDFDPIITNAEKFPHVAWAMLICGVLGGLLVAVFCNRNDGNK